MGILGHSATLIGIEENIVYVERCRHQTLIIGLGTFATIAIKGSYRPKNFTEWAEVDANLDLVVLKSNKWKSKTRIAAEPELKRNVKGCLWESLSGGTYLSDAVSITCGTDIGVRWVNYIG